MRVLLTTDTVGGVWTFTKEFDWAASYKWSFCCFAELWARSLKHTAYLGGTNCSSVRRMLLLQGLRSAA